MREYASVSAKFWIGETGKLLRGKPEAQILALYLMSSPHSNMLGVYHCPILYMGHETGLGIEGAAKGLASLIEVGFCEYDEASETVFVVNMASYQVGEQLKEGDNRILGVRKEYSKITCAHIKQRFFATYCEAFFLIPEAVKGEKTKPLTSPFKAPPKQLTGTGTGTGDKNNESDDSSKADPEKQKEKKATRLPNDWELTGELRDWTTAERSDLDPDAVLSQFKDYWSAVGGANGRKLDWVATWRNWVRNTKTPFAGAKRTGSGILAGAI